MIVFCDFERQGVFGFAHEIIINLGDSMSTTKISGILEIDHDRGVIYFHADSSVENYIGSVLRICGLKKPIPEILPPLGQLDITVTESKISVIPAGGTW